MQIGAKILSHGILAEKCGIQVGELYFEGRYRQSLVARPTRGCSPQAAARMLQNPAPLPWQQGRNQNVSARFWLAGVRALMETAAAFM